jgi:hypothetical protein
MAFENQAGCILSNYAPFAEYNFGPLGRILFVLARFERELKTLFRVLFFSLYIKIKIVLLLWYFHFWSDSELIRQL